MFSTKVQSVSTEKNEAKFLFIISKLNHNFQSTRESKPAHLRNL